MRDGNIRGILDWEMAHLGDPLEDLAWSLDPLWSHGDTARAAGTIPRTQAIQIWEQESGLRFHPVAFPWWEIFASLKGLGIWISAAREYFEGRNSDAVNAFSGWYCLAFHNKVLADAFVGEAGMKPEADQVLNVSAMQLLTQILPQLPPGYAQGTASLLAVLSVMAAQEYERGAEIRSAENEDMRALFRDLAPLLEDGALNRS